LLICNHQEISIECFEKARANKKLLPLNCIRNYKVLYYETSSPFLRPNYDRSPTLMRRQLNASPNQNAENKQQPQQQQQQQLATIQTRRSPTLNITSSLNGQFVSQSLPAAPKTADAYYRAKHENAVHERNVYSSSFYKKALTTVNAAESKSAAAGSGNDFSRIKFSSMGARNRTQPSLNSLELKPATVEGKVLLVRRNYL
jgi:hypothetical protein